MQIVVSDIVTLTDLCTTGLLPHCKRHGYDVCTTDFVLADARQPGLKKLFDEAVAQHLLTVEKYEFQELSNVYNMYQELQQTDQITMTDCSVAYYAMQQNCVILTADSNFYRFAQNHKIAAYNTLWLVDKLVTSGYTSHQVMLDLMEQWKTANYSVSRRQIDELIYKYRAFVNNA